MIRSTAYRQKNREETKRLLFFATSMSFVLKKMQREKKIYIYLCVYVCACNADVNCCAVVTACYS